MAGERFQRLFVFPTVSCGRVGGTAAYEIYEVVINGSYGMPVGSGFSFAHLRRLPMTIILFEAPTPGIGSSKTAGPIWGISDMMESKLQVESGNSNCLSTLSSLTILHV